MTPIEKLAKKLSTNRMTLMEEARGLQSLMPRRRSIHGMSLREIARRLGRSYSWVRLRLVLMELPVEVHEAADAGLFTVSDLDVAASLSKRHWKTAALRILEDKKLGNYPDCKDIRHKSTRQSTKRIKTMFNYLSSRGIEGLPLYLLTWCMGQISDKHIQNKIKEVLYAQAENETDDGGNGKISGRGYS
jgi:hypothetical protein